MSKANVFAKNQALEKALGGYRPHFRYGERLQMYNHVYKVIAYQDNGYTFLEDEKNAKVAYPTNKLRMLMKNQTCRTLGVINTLTSMEPNGQVEKAQISGPGSKVGVTPRAINEAYAKQGSGDTKQPSGQPRGEPVGTVKTGQDGQTYKKTQANPAVWVRVATGTVHHDPHGEEQDPRSVSQPMRDQFSQMSNHLDKMIHPDDRAKIHTKFEEWFKENAKFKHMQMAHNVNEVDSSGQKLPRAGIPHAALQQVFRQGDKAKEIRQQLLDLVKKSVLKRKGDANAK